MVESPSSPTFDEPPIERLGLIHDKAPFDPITTDLGDKIQPSGSSRTAPDAGNPDTEAEGWLEENATIHEEVELEDCIRRELHQLTIVQAEIEAAHEILGAVHDEEEGKDVEAEKKENIDEENHKVENNVEEENESREIGQDTQFVKSENGTFAESLMEENENEKGGEEDEGNVEGLWGEEVMKIERDNHNNNRRKNNYPTRPDAEDCAYYMRFGSCKFGLHCKFNHPPGRKNQVKDKAKHREENSERIGQAECRYYLTSGGCRYGKDCKYSHASDKSSSSHNQEFNFLGLPIRPGEKECPFYMRTGSCKYGPNCRFHHPDPKAVAASGSPSGYGNVMFPPTQGGATPNSEWNGYQAVAYPTSERRSLPTPPAFAMNNLSTEINFPVQSLHGMIVEEYPERPGEPECSFFLKTGDCKFKSNCKFHHPKNRCPNTMVNLFALNDKGLPLRPDQPMCMYYHRYGICKYGPSCKYDHPSNFGIVPSPDLLPFGNSKIVNGSETTGLGNETKPSV